MSNQSSRPDFELAVENYDAFFPGHVTQHYLKKRIAYVHRLLSAGRVLDVGCGTGVFAQALATDAKYDVVGVDPSDAMLKQAVAGRAKLTQATAEALPFPDQSFDLVISIAAFHHFVDPDRASKAVKEMARVVRPGGQIVIWDMNGRNPLLQPLMQRIPWDRDVRVLSSEEFKKLSIDAGLTEIVIRRLGWVPQFLPAWLVPLVRPIELLLEQIRVADRYAAHLVVRATRPLSSARPAGKVAAVLPAYNAGRTLERTVADIPRTWVDDIILVDDASSDDTVAIARRLGLHVVVHPRNRGYGGNQKTCYRTALERGADVVVMVHPDHQYDPKAIPDLIAPILNGQADAVFGSRMMHPRNALLGGMPWWKFIGNIVLTQLANLRLGFRLTEYHSGFRAYSRHVLETLPLEQNSDAFVFDTEIILQLLQYRFRILEVPIATRYFKEASSVSFTGSVRYGLDILRRLRKFRYDSSPRQ